MTTRRNILLATSSALLGSTVQAGTTPTQTSSQDGETIVLGKRRFLNSEILGEKRFWREHQPHISENEKDVPITALYVIDGERFFTTAVAYAQFFGAGQHSKLGRCLVIGVENDHDRTRDLTPSSTQARRDGTVDKTAQPQGGGADKFLSFLRNELRPAVESDLPPNAKIVRHVLLGHSFGGLFALSVLAHHPDYFDYYITADPSFWWDQRKLITQLANQGIPNYQGKNKSLYMAFGTLPRKEVAARWEKSSDLRQQMIAKLRSQGVNVQHREFPDEVHATIPYPGFFDGLKTFFGSLPPDILPRKKVQ